MSRLSQLVRVAVLIAVLGGLAALFWRSVAPEPFRGSFRTQAMFRDASGLPPGSRVVIAGVPVGVIAGVTLEGRLAQVNMRLADDVVLWDNAYAEKKATSPLGDSYIEINPGSPDGSSVLPDSVDPATGRRQSHPPPQPGPRHQLVSGEPIRQVIEGSSTDAVLRTIDQAMPRVETAVDAFRAGVLDARQHLNGDLVSRIEAIDAWLGTDQLSRGLGAVHTQVDRVEDWSVDAADATDGLGPSMNRWMDDAADGVADFRADTATARTDMEGAFADVRRRLDELDAYATRADTALAALADPDDQGRLARMIHDGELGQIIEDSTETGKALFGTVANIETYVGLRTEYNLLALQPRFYVTAEIHPHSDKFYVIEFEKGALGGVPETRLTYNPDTASYTRRVVIREDLRFTMQLGKRLDWLSLRFGLKESTVGVGADVTPWGGRLKLSADLFGNFYSDQPRLKLAAALEVFRTVYILAGVDDVLSTPGTLPLTPYPDDPGVPLQFDEVRYGRDYFVGAMLHFNELDLATMLTVYGAALVAVL